MATTHSARAAEPRRGLSEGRYERPGPAALAPVGEPETPAPASEPGDVPMIEEPDTPEPATLPGQEGSTEPTKQPEGLSTRAIRTVRPSTKVISQARSPDPTPLQQALPIQ
jgi:hypothetical protein